jgi:hypothetical protein
MVAYSFAPRFVEPILNGTKAQTIRAPGKRRHAAPGDALQLYTGMRTKQCKLIRRARCTDVEAIRLRFDRPDVTTVGEYISKPAELDRFARCDGFQDYADMRAFWRQKHGDLDRFEGVLIRWAA